MYKMSNNLGFEVDDQHDMLTRQRDIDYIRAYNRGVAHALAMNELRASYMFPGPSHLPDGMRLIGGGSATMDGTTLANANYASLTTGGKVNRLRKAKKWTAFAKDVAQDALGLASSVAEPSVGGKVNRLKKAKKWTAFAKDVAKDALGLASSVSEPSVGAGKVNRLKKAKKWTAFAKDVAQDTLGLAASAAPIAGAGKPKRVSAWIKHVKNYAAEHDIPYKEAMTKAKATYKK